MQRRVQRFNQSIESLESRLMLSAAVAHVSNGLTHAQLLSLYANGKSELKSAAANLLGDVSSNLQELYSMNPTGVGISAQQFGTIESSAGNPGVAVHTRGSVTSLLSSLEKLGLKTVSVNPSTHMVDGFLPTSSLVLAAKLSGVTSIAALNKAAVHSVGSAVNQGEAVENVAAARNTFGVDGTGVKIGVISDSANRSTGGIASSVASGDLPNNVTILKDGLAGDTDEGRAMMEEIHDMAPGAQLYFYSGDPSQDAMVTAINALKNAGCKVIVDDLGYTDEPMFQDGVISKAINTFVANGGSYFSAIGNDGSSGYLHTNTTYTTTNGATWVNWANNGQASGETLSFNTNGPVDINLQWDNPYNGDTGTATADLDVYIYQGSKLIESSLDDNIASGVPEELLNTLPAGTYQMKVQVAALSPGAVAPDMIKFVAAEDADGGLTAVQYQGATGLRSSGYGHGAGQNTISVGAVEFASAPPFSNTKPIHSEDFSSTGPIIYAFDSSGNKLSTPLTLDKPDVSGVDGINTSFFGEVTSDDPTTLPQFYGTSAAAPNVAAIAALLDQSKPGLTESQILAALKSSTTALNSAVAGAYDEQGGFGLVDANKALAFFNSTAVAPTVSLATVASPRTTPLASETIKFSEPVVGFTLADLNLSYNGGANLLTGAQTLTSTDQTTFTLTNLSSLTTAPGNYSLSLATTGITGSGLPLVNGDFVNWVNNSPLPPTVTLGNINSPRTTPVNNETITFSEAVVGMKFSDLTLTRNGSGNLLGGSQTLTTSDNTNFLLNNLSTLTAPVGTYVLTLKNAGISSSGLALAAGASVTWQVNGSNSPPTVTLSAIGSPRATTVNSETITFNEPVTGLALTNFTLSRNLGGDLITTNQTLTTTDNITFTLGNLSGITNVTGSYVLKLSPAGVTGTGGNLNTGASISWQMTATIPVAPTVVLAAVGPQTGSISSETITFSEPVAGFTLANLSLTVNGGANLLTGAQTLTSQDQTVFTLSNLSGITAANGTYVLTLSPGGITGTGLAMTAGASVTWVTAPPPMPPTVTLAPITSPTVNPVASEVITFNEPITGLTLADLTLTRNGGANLLTSAQTLTSPDQTVFTLTNLGGLTAPAGNYVLTLGTTGIMGAGFPLAAGASVSWTNNTTATPPFVVLAGVGTPRSTPISTELINFNEAVVGFTLANLKLTRNGGANLLTASQTLTTADQTSFTLNNLSSITSAGGTYVLTLSPGSITGSGLPLAAGTSVTWVNTSGTITTPVASIGNASVVKPSSGTIPMNFTVTLSAASTSAVTIKYATVAGSASAGGGDYVGVPSGTLTIPAGQTTGTITITIKGNTLKNTPKVFTVDLTSSTNATLGTTMGTGTILSGTALPSITFPTTTAYKASTTATTVLSIPVTLTSAATTTVTITFTTVAGTASSGAGDYVGIPNGTLTIAAGQTVGHILITVKPHVATTNKTFSVTLTGAANATLTNTTDKITLT